jgi:hypothetical protein
MEEQEILHFMISGYKLASSICQQYLQSRGIYFLLGTIKFTKELISHIAVKIGIWKSAQFYLKLKKLPYLYNVCTEPLLPTIINSQRLDATLKYVFNPKSESLICCETYRQS